MLILDQISQILLFVLVLFFVRIIWAQRRSGSRSTSFLMLLWSLAYLFGPIVYLFGVNVHHFTDILAVSSVLSLTIIHATESKNEQIKKKKLQVVLKLPVLLLFIAPLLKERYQVFTYIAFLAIISVLIVWKDKDGKRLLLRYLLLSTLLNLVIIVLEYYRFLAIGPILRCIYVPSMYAALNLMKTKDVISEKVNI